MLFSPARALHITLEAVRQEPKHAEGIVLGMIAAVEGYDAMIGQEMADTERAERPAPKGDGKARTLPVPARA